MDDENNEIENCNIIPLYREILTEQRRNLKNFQVIAILESISIIVLLVINFIK